MNVASSSKSKFLARILPLVLTLSSIITSGIDYPDLESKTNEILLERSSHTVSLILMDITLQQIPRVEASNIPNTITT